MLPAFSDRPQDVLLVGNDVPPTYHGREKRSTVETKVRNPPRRESKRREKVENPEPDKTGEEWEESGSRKLPVRLGG